MERLESRNGFKVSGDPVGDLLFVVLSVGGVHGEVAEFLPFAIELVTVALQEFGCTCGAGSFVAVDEALGCGKAEEVCGGHFGDVLVEVLAEHLGLGGARGGKDGVVVDHAGVTAVPMELVGVDFEDVVVGKEFDWVHARLTRHKRTRR